MEEPGGAYAVYLWLAAIFLVILTNHLRRQKLRLPPGPKQWPIIGNLNLIGPLPHHSIHELAKKYGPLMMLRFGSVNVVVGSSVEMAKLFLQTYDVIFAGRPKTAAGKYTGYNYSDITWSEYGPYWRQARKLCLMELFSVKRLKSYEHIRIEERTSMLGGIYSTKGEPMLLKGYQSTLGLNVISRMVLGRRYLDYDSEEKSVIKVEEFKMMIDDWFLLNGVYNLGDWIPCIKHLDVQGYVKRMKILGHKFDRFLQHMLDEHNARREAEKEDWVPKDLVDVLLQLSADPNLEIKLGETQVKALTLDLIVGGTETSTVTIEWAMSELIRRPDIIGKATTELDEVIGKERWVQEEDIQNLPYICAIVKETMRLHPVSPNLAPHLSREQVKIEGYDIPKDSVVLVNIYSIQRDPKVYERPDEFRPERFLEKNINVHGRDFELLPFGSGRRMCAGKSLGLKIIESSLANLLHGFSWTLPSNMNVEDLGMDEIFGLSNPKKIPLMACAKPRLHHHMYHL